eukprot:scaffold793_cov161-Amphora_coffeaeformis.AAC.1
MRFCAPAWHKTTRKREQSKCPHTIASVRRRILHYSVRHVQKKEKEGKKRCRRPQEETYHHPITFVMFDNGVQHRRVPRNPFSGGASRGPKTLSYNDGRHNKSANPRAGGRKSCWTSPFSVLSLCFVAIFATYSMLSDPYTPVDTSKYAPPKSAGGGGKSLAFTVDTPNDPSSLTTNNNQIKSPSNPKPQPKVEVSNKLPPFDEGQPTEDSQDNSEGEYNSPDDEPEDEPDDYDSQDNLPDMHADGDSQWESPYTDDNSSTDGDDVDDDVSTDGDNVDSADADDDGNLENDGGSDGGSIDDPKEKEVVADETNEHETPMEDGIVEEGDDDESKDGGDGGSETEVKETDSFVIIPEGDDDQVVMKQDGDQDGGEDGGAEVDSAADEITDPKEDIIPIILEEDEGGDGGEQESVAVKEIDGSDVAEEKKNPPFGVDADGADGADGSEQDKGSDGGDKEKAGGAEETKTSSIDVDTNEVSRA